MPRKLSLPTLTVDGGVSVCHQVAVSSQCRPLVSRVLPLVCGWRTTVVAFLYPWVTMGLCEALTGQA